jgi:hypothetical protein
MWPETGKILSNITFQYGGRTFVCFASIKRIYIFREGNQDLTGDLNTYNAMQLRTSK